MIHDFAIVIYTHSDYSDAWGICIEGHDKFTKGIKKYVFLNKKDDRIPDDYIQIIYTDGAPYTHRFKQGLEGVTEKYVLLTHEDFFLFNTVNFDKIQSYVELLDNQPELSFVRLIKCGETSNTKYCDIPDLYTIPYQSNHIFAVQAAIWNKNTLHKVYQNNPSKVPSLMEKPHVQKYCRNHKINGLYSHTTDAKKRGRIHWDSAVYGYMATGIVRGKWNYSEYHDEYNELFAKHGIDKNIRGTV
jgi:hypothetical protein